MLDEDYRRKFRGAVHAWRRPQHVTGWLIRLLCGLPGSAAQNFPSNVLESQEELPVSAKAVASLG
jgi:hypothetical protein